MDADALTLPAVDALGETVGRGEPGGELGRGDGVGRFVVIGRLGQGGMGVVYAAFDPELDRKVAIKLVLPERRGGAEARARMLREAQAMARLAHPNVVAVHDVGALGDRIWIAMEYVGGQTLTDWLGERRRSWRQVVDVFLQAGEGLRAAHAAGLVHRDFKPDNVMIGDDGRARVMDFGLARAEAAVADGERTGDPLATQAGTLVGTPRYMAPEQWQGRVADAQADQFAFCVALWEALHGQPPFAGDDVPALMVAVLAGAVRTPANSGAVPWWLRRTLRRGLAVAPGQRWPSMAALLAALDRRPRQRRVAAAVVVLAGLVGGAALALRADADPCATAGAAIDRVWDAERGSAIAAAFRATGVVYAEDTWTRVRPDLETYAAAWTAEATAACRSEDPQELVQLCLERRRVEFGALVEVLAAATPEVVEHARQAVRRLTPPVSCRDTRLAELEASLPLPEDPLAVGALRERLSRVAAEESAGQYATALAGAAALQAEADAARYMPLIAEVALRRGTIQGRMNKFADADDALVAAIAAADEAGHDLARAEAMVARIDVAGVRLARQELMRAWIPMTQGLVARVAPDSPLAALMWTHAGLVAAAGYRFDEAEQLHRRALAQLERISADDDPARISALVNLSEALHKQDRGAEGLAMLTEAEALTRRVLGPEHPLLIHLYNCFGNTQVDPTFAPAYYEKALALSERVFGRRSPSVAAALANIAELEMLDGDVAGAREKYFRAADIIADTYDESNPRRALYLLGVGEAQARSGEYAAARVTYARSEAIYALHPWTPEAVWAINGLGLTYALERRWEDALAEYHRANELLNSRAMEVPHLFTDGLRGEATALLELGRPAEAVEVARRLIDHPEKFNRRGVGKTRFVLARALYALGRREEAFAEAEAALGELSSEHFDAPATMAEIEAWFASVRTPGDPPRPPRELR